MRKHIENMTVNELRKEHDRIMEAIHEGDKTQKIRDRLGKVQARLIDKGYVIKRIWVKESKLYT